MIDELLSLMSLTIESALKVKEDGVTSVEFCLEAGPSHISATPDLVIRLQSSIQYISFYSTSPTPTKSIFPST